VRQFDQTAVRHGVTRSDGDAWVGDRLTLTLFIDHLVTKWCE
jgi:hypothetical protein